MFSILAGSSVEKTEADFLNTKKWMESIKGERLLSCISMPGSHDTMAWTASGSLQSFINCHSDDLLTQLNDGIRFIDIRLHHKNKILHCHHGSYDLGMEFDRVIKDCKSFLDANPSECIVMSIKRENGEGGGNDKETFKDAVDKYIDTYSKRNYWYMKTSIPMLNEVRGKIVMISRFPVDNDFDESRYGLRAWDGWLDNNPDFHIDLKHTDPSKCEMLVIQDYYNLSAPYINRGRKGDAINTYITKAGEGYKPYQWFLNFISCFEVLPITWTASYFNGYTKGRLTNDGARWGTFLMDYIPQDLINKIISHAINGK